MRHIYIRSTQAGSNDLHQDVFLTWKFRNGPRLVVESGLMAKYETFIFCDFALLQASSICIHSKPRIFIFTDNFRWHCF
jgi:hypothetical protein